MLKWSVMPYKINRAVMTRDEGLMKDKQGGRITVEQKGSKLDCKTRWLLLTKRERDDVMAAAGEKIQGWGQEIDRQWNE